MKSCQLTTRKVAAAKKPGYLSDGCGLYLQITKATTKKGGVTRAWVYRYSFGGRRREMGLGGEGGVSLKQARELAREARAHVLRGDDPIAIRQAKKDKINAEVAKR